MHFDNKYDHYNIFSSYKDPQTDILMEEPHVTKMLAVDISHPDVKELMLAGYSEAQSISAIEECGTLNKAIKYLISQTDGSQKVSETEASNNAEDKSFQYGVERALIHV